MGRKDKERGDRKGENRAKATENRAETVKYREGTPENRAGTRENRVRTVKYREGILEGQL